MFFTLLMKSLFKRTLLFVSLLFVCSFSFGQIIITEFSYDPPESGTDSLEFIEIANIGNQVVDISGYKLLFGSTIAERFVYPANTTLGPNQVSVIAVNAAALQRCYNMTTLARQWTGTTGLGNSGSKIVLRTAANVTVDSISFTSGAAPTGTNGNGKTAVLCDFTLDNNVMANWTASTNAILRNDAPYTVNGKALFGSPGFLECGLTTDPDPVTETNDEIENAVVLTVGTTCVPIAGNLLDATESLEGCTGSGAANDVWYSFVATSIALMIDVLTEEDIVLAVYSGDVDNLEEMVCMDAVSENEQYSSASFVIGNTYFVRVFAYDYDDVVSGDFTICVSEFDVVENNDCTSAIALTSSIDCTPIRGTLTNATATLIEESPCNGYEIKDVWFSFVAQSPITTIFVAEIDDMDAIVEVFQGDCDNRTYLACQDGSGYTEEVDLTNLTVGNTYYIRISDYYEAIAGSTEFSICVTHEVVNPCEGVTIAGAVAGCGTDAEVTVNGGLAPYTFSWSNNEMTASVTNLVVGESYTVFIADANGCEGEVIYLPVACPVVDPCEGVDITGTVAGCGTDAEVTVSGGLAPYTFSWSNDETTATVSNLVVGESYTVFIADANGCEGEVIYVPVACPVVDPCDGVEVTADVDGCDGEMRVTPAGGTEPYTYLWSNGVTTQTAIVDINDEEVYFVTVTDVNGCSTTEDFEWRDCASVAKVDGLSTFNVYPNPTNNRVTIEIETISAEQLKIELINALGQLVLVTDVVNTGKGQHTLSLDTIPSGLYLISIKGKDISKTERLNVIK